MRNRNMKLVQKITAPVILISIMSQAFAEEKIIQQEKISFDKCLKVITTSQNKLSIAPEIIDESDKKRVALFSLIDGVLTITCDGVNGLVTVSTKTN